MRTPVPLNWQFLCPYNKKGHLLCPYDKNASLDKRAQINAKLIQQKALECHDEVKKEILDSIKGFMHNTPRAVCEERYKKVLFQKHNLKIFPKRSRTICGKKTGHRTH